MRRRGLTLIEVMIAGALGFVVLGVAWDTMSAGLKLWQADLNRGSRQAQALSLECRLSQELSSTTADSVSATGPDLAFLLPGAAVDPSSGLPVWSRFVVYRSADHQVTRQECGHSGFPGLTPLALTPAEIASAPPGRVVLRDVQAFHAEVDGRLCRLQLVLKDFRTRRTAVCLQEVKR